MMCDEITIGWVLILVVVIGIFVYDMIEKTNEVNEMGDMICKEQNSSYEFKSFDSDSKEITCVKPDSRTAYDGGYIRVERGD